MSGDMAKKSEADKRKKRGRERGREGGRVRVRMFACMRRGAWEGGVGRVG